MPELTMTPNLLAGVFIVAIIIGVIGAIIIELFDNDNDGQL